MKRALIATLALVTMVGCAEEESFDKATSEDYVVEFGSSSIGTRTTTNASGVDEWIADSDQIGISTIGFDSDVTNYKYYAKTSGETTTFVASNSSIVFPNVAETDDRTVNFVAYYPYGSLSGDTGTIVNIDLSGQSYGYHDYDYMFAKEENYEYYQGCEYNAVDFTFEHLLSKVVMVVELNDNLTSLETLTATIKNTWVTGTLDVTTGVVAIGNDGDQDINLTVVEGAKDGYGNVTTATVTAILFPGVYNTTPSLEFKVEDRTFTSSFNTTLTAAKSHSFKLYLGNDITGFESGSTIGEWGGDGSTTTLYPEESNN